MSLASIVFFLNRNRESTHNNAMYAYCLKYPFNMFFISLEFSANTNKKGRRFNSLTFHCPMYQDSTYIKLQNVLIRSQAVVRDNSCNSLDH